MILNHERKSPRDWDDAVPSLCPDCKEPLIARRGKILVWHWAHKSAPGKSPIQCWATETEWHLTWKSVYEAFPGWEIEVLCETGKGEQFRLDAVNRRTGKIREFVHSLSDKYVHKHTALRAAGADVLWIFDGNVFVAERSKSIRNGGIKHLLKPKARQLYSQIGGFVHYDNHLWKEWDYDCWYPIESGTPAQLVASFINALHAHRSRLREEMNEAIP